MRLGITSKCLRCISATGLVLLLVSVEEPQGKNPLRGSSGKPAERFVLGLEMLEL